MKIISDATIGLIIIIIGIILAFAFPYVSIPIIVICVIISIVRRNKRKTKNPNEDIVDNTINLNNMTPQNFIDRIETTSPINYNESVIPIAKNENISIKHSPIRTKSDYSDYYRFMQKWDESYNKDLGYEWFRVCVEYTKFPIYNSLHMRLYNIRKFQDLTQINVAKFVEMSTSTLSSYENGYSVPNDSKLNAFANYYGVPFSFLKYGYADSLDSHIRLCQLYDESKYLQSLRISVRAASNLFPELLNKEKSGSTYVLKLLHPIANLKTPEEMDDKRGVGNEI